MNHLSISMNELRGQLPVNFTFRAAARLSALVEQYAGLVQETPLLDESTKQHHIDQVNSVREKISLSRKSPSWKAARTHFFEAMTQFVGCIEVVDQIANENLPRQQVEVTVSRG